MREEQSKNSVLGKLRAESVPELQEERKVQEEKRGKRHPVPVWMKPKEALPLEKKRSETMKFRITEEEAEKIRRRMTSCGSSVQAAYLRKMAMNGYILRLDLSSVREVGRLIANISNNINQIARKANEGGVVSEQNIQEIKSGQKKIYEELRKLYDIFYVLGDQ